jgi:hypothetical protein
MDEPLVPLSAGGGLLRARSAKSPGLVQGTRSFPDAWGISQPLQNFLEGQKNVLTPAVTDKKNPESRCVESGYRLIVEDEAPEASVSLCVNVPTNSEKVNRAVASRLGIQEVRDAWIPLGSG